MAESSPSLLEQAKGAYLKLIEVTAGPEAAKHAQANLDALGRGDIAAAYREKGETGKAQWKFLASSAHDAYIESFRLTGGDEAAKHAQANLDALGRGDIAAAYREKGETSQATRHHLVEIADSLLVAPQKTPANKSPQAQSPSNIK